MLMAWIEMVPEMFDAQKQNRAQDVFISLTVMESNICFDTKSPLECVFLVRYFVWWPARRPQVENNVIGSRPHSASKSAATLCVCSHAKDSGGHRGQLSNHW